MLCNAPVVCLSSAAATGFQECRSSISIVATKPDTKRRSVLKMGDDDEDHKATVGKTRGLQRVWHQKAVYLKMRGGSGEERRNGADSRGPPGDSRVWPLDAHWPP